MTVNMLSIVDVRDLSEFSGKSIAFPAINGCEKEKLNRLPVSASKSRAEHP